MAIPATAATSATPTSVVPTTPAQSPATVQPKNSPIATVQSRWRYFIPTTTSIWMAAVTVGGTVYETAYYHLHTELARRIREAAAAAVPVAGHVWGAIKAHKTVPLEVVYVAASGVALVASLATSFVLNVVAIKIFKIKPPTAEEQDKLLLHSSAIFPSFTPAQLTALVPSFSSSPALTAPESPTSTSTSSTSSTSETRTATFSTVKEEPVTSTADVQEPRRLSFRLQAGASLAKLHEIMSKRQAKKSTKEHLAEKASKEDTFDNALDAHYCGSFMLLLKGLIENIKSWAAARRKRRAEIKAKNQELKRITRQFLAD